MCKSGARGAFANGFALGAGALGRGRNTLPQYLQYIKNKCKLHTYYVIIELWQNKNLHLQQCV